MYDIRRLAFFGLFLLFMPGLALSSEHEAPDADAQLAELEAMCAASAEARAERHEAKALFHRLGGEEKIHALTAEVVRLHHANPAIAHLMEGVDDAHLARKVAEFMIAGLGGPPVYKGPSLPDSHRHLKLSNADFMAAGGDIIQAMKNLEYGQEEIDEVVCTLVALRDQVVLGEADETALAH